MIGIYKITSPNGRAYIGQSIDIQRRFSFYKHLNCKKQPVLYRSFVKYGVDNHTFEILELCSFNDLNIKERYWQEFYNVLNEGLNCNLTETDVLPKIYSQETKDKISKSNTGKVFTDEHKQHLSETKKLTTIGSNNSFYGKTHTDDFKKERSVKRSRGGNPKAKKVIDTNTTLIYDCAKDVAEQFNLNYNTFKSQLSGLYPNKTSFRYI